MECYYRLVRDGVVGLISQVEFAPGELFSPCPCCGLLVAIDSAPDEWEWWDGEDWLPTEGLTGDNPPDLFACSCGAQWAGEVG